MEQQLLGESRLYHIRVIIPKKAMKGNGRYGAASTSLVDTISA